MFYSSFDIFLVVGLKFGRKEPVVEGGGVLWRYHNYWNINEIW